MTPLTLTIELHFVAAKCLQLYPDPYETEESDPDLHETDADPQHAYRKQNHLIVDGHFLLKVACFGINFHKFIAGSG